MVLLNPDKKENMIHDKSQLTKLFRDGCKSEEDFKIGLEYEKLAVNSDNFKAIPYHGEKGLCNFLSCYKSVEEMENVLDDGNLIGLRGDSYYISLEPGSQTEISTLPYKRIADIADKISTYNNKTAIIAEELGINWIGYGIQPVSTYENIKIIPKKRYEIMTDYLPLKGSKALVMMRETAGLQASVDYKSEEDAMNKLRVALGISPIITAMFANSPIRNGKETGYKSYRASSWLKTDDDRCGFIGRKIFEGEFSFDDYAEYLLNIPMFSIERNNTVINATHLTFREFLNNGLDEFTASPEDWDIHTSTVFPDVRLRNYIEIRNCDSQKTDMVLAFLSLTKGIMYSENALNQAWELVKDFNWKELQEMRYLVPIHGLETVINGVKVSDLAKELVNIAENALLSNPETKEEAVYLEKLKELVEQKITPADIILKNWHAGWNKEVGKLVEYSKLH